MSIPAPEPVRRVVPAHEKRCVWMTAGILSYRICQRDYDCAKCELDQALRLQCGDTAEGGLDPVPPLHMLHRGHVWVRPGSDGHLTVGLDDFARRLIGPVTWIDLPAPGARVCRGEPAFRVSHGPHETDVVAPVTGTVSDVNRSLTENPGRINRSPFDAGWILRLRADDLATDLVDLLFGRPLEAWLCDEMRRLSRAIAQALGVDDGGADHVRRNDGGEVSPDLLNGLPADTRTTLLRSFLRSSDESPSTPMGE